MNKDQSKKVNAIDSTLAVLNTTEHKTAWAGNATFSSAVDSVQNNMDILNTADAVRLSGSGPYTEKKEQVKAALIAVTMHHAIAGVGYAASINDIGLKATFSITESNLLRSADADLGNLCMNIYTAAQSVIGSMSAWGINSGTVSTLLSNINTFNALMGTPQAQINTQNAASEAIDTQIDIIDAILTDTIDTLMIQFKSGNSAFYNAYFSARKLHNTGVRHSTTFEGFIYTAGGMGLANILVTVDLNGKQVRKHYTDTSGHYRFTRLHLGTYVLTVSGAGYVAQTKTFVVDVLQHIDTDFTLTM